jgi:hypothetical protein
MSIAKITKDAVFKVASQLRNKGIKPTVSRVREKLKSGSATTVHKYLSEWKNSNVEGTKLDPQQLQRQLAEQLKICENLSHELLNSSTLVASETARNAKLEGRVLELETRLHEKAQSEANLKESFDATVAMLTDQIQAINAHAIDKIQAAGQHYDDAVMDLKLQLRELKDQLQLKDKEIKKLKSEALDRSITASKSLMERG